MAIKSYHCIYPHKNHRYSEKLYHKAFTIPLEGHFLLSIEEKNRISLVHLSMRGSAWELQGRCAQFRGKRQWTYRRPTYFLTFVGHKIRSTKPEPDQKPNWPSNVHLSKTLNNQLASRFYATYTKLIVLLFLQQVLGTFHLKWKERNNDAYLALTKWGLFYTYSSGGNTQLGRILGVSSQHITHTAKDKVSECSVKESFHLAFRLSNFLTNYSWM